MPYQKTNKRSNAILVEGAEKGASQGVLVMQMYQKAADGAESEAPQASTIPPSGNIPTDPPERK